MSKTEFHGDYHTDLGLDIPGLPPEVEPYIINFDLEAFSSAISQINNRLESIAEINRLLAMLDRTTKYQSKTETTKRKHKEMYKIMKASDAFYRYDQKKPSWLEYSEALADKGYFGSKKKCKQKLYCEKTLREIYKQGKENKW